ASLIARPATEAAESTALPRSSGSNILLSVAEPDQKSQLHAAVNSFGKLPLSFELNEGQTDPEVKFIARGQGYGLFLTSTGAVLKLGNSVNIESAVNQMSPDDEVRGPSLGGTENISMRFKGSRRVPHPVGLDTLPGKSNYFVGNNA